MTPHPAWDAQVWAGSLIAIYVVFIGVIAWLDDKWP